MALKMRPDCRKLLSLGLRPLWMAWTSGAARF